METSSLQYRHPEKRLSSGYLAEDTLDPSQQRPSQYRNAVTGPKKIQRGAVRGQQEASLQPKESIDASQGSQLDNYNQFRQSVKFVAIEKNSIAMSNQDNKKFEVYSENNNSLGYAETTSIGQSRLPQSTSQERIGKKIIRPNAINNASKHFPKDFFNYKDRVKKKREGAGTSEHCNRQRLGRSTMFKVSRTLLEPATVQSAT
jgi:hypothetical protein